RARRDGRVHRRRVADVGVDVLHGVAVARAQPLEVLLDPRAGEVVEQYHVLAVAEQPVGEVGADEAGPAGDQHASAAVAGARHRVRPRRASSAEARPAWSTAVWWASHAASSVMPASKDTLGA